MLVHELEQRSELVGAATVSSRVARSVEERRLSGKQPLSRMGCTGRVRRCGLQNAETPWRGNRYQDGRYTAKSVGFATAAIAH